MTIDIEHLIPEYLDDKDERLAQKYAFEQLHNLVQSKRVVFFVGAGVSKSVGYPDWDEIITGLENEALELQHIVKPFKKDDKLKKENILAYAELLKSFFRDTNNQELYNSYFSRKLKDLRFIEDKLPNNLLRLQPSAVITTNYDNVLVECLKKQQNMPNSGPIHILESGFCNNSFINDFFERIDSNSLAERVIYLHGHMDQPNSIVFSKSDYNRIYGEEVSSQPGLSSQDLIHRRFLWTIFASRRVMFIGFSLRDPEITRILYQCANDLWLFGREKHYIFVQITKESSYKCLTEAKQIYIKFGIKSIFYDVQGGDHSKLDEYIKILAHESSSKGIATKESQLANNTKAGSWRERVTQKMLRDGNED